MDQFSSFPAHPFNIKAQILMILHIKVLVIHLKRKTSKSLLFTVWFDAYIFHSFICYSAISFSDWNQLYDLKAEDHMWTLLQTMFITFIYASIKYMCTHRLVGLWGFMSYL